MGKRSKEIRAAEKERRSGGKKSAGERKEEWERNHVKRAARKPENAQFERFYQAQRAWQRFPPARAFQLKVQCCCAEIVPVGEWDAFLAAARSPLPVCFRVPAGPAKARLDVRPTHRCTLCGRRSCLEGCPGGAGRQRRAAG